MMTGTAVLIYLIGGVALLLLGVKMVRKGVTNSFGVVLRQTIERGTQSRVRGFVSGLCVTGLFQSSTATLLILTAFAEKGIISTASALAVALGADVGTTLIAQILSFDLYWLGPICVAMGMMGQAGSKKNRRYYISKSIVGLGLMLLALDLIVEATAPLKTSPVISGVMTVLADDLPFLFILSVFLTALSHSSLAIVLFIMSLAASGFMPMMAALVGVLGANVGGAIPPLMMNIREPGEGRMVAWGVFFMRLIGALIFALIVLPLLYGHFDIISANPARQVVNFHTGFNLIRALMFLPFIGLIALALKRFVPHFNEARKNKAQTKYLDKNALESPAIALPLAKREVLRMGDVVQSMLSNVINLFYGENRHMIAEVKDKDDIVDELYNSVKLYLSRMSENEMDQRQSAECQNILIFATNLEHIGDVIDKNLCEIGAKRINTGVELSEEGLREIIDFHGEVMSNVRLAMNVFMSGDISLAQQLIDKEAHIREAAHKTSMLHFERMRQGVDKTLQSSSLHLDIVRDLQRISDYVTHFAVAIIEEHERVQASKQKKKREEQKES